MFKKNFRFLFMAAVLLPLLLLIACAGGNKAMQQTPEAQWEQIVLDDVEFVSFQSLEGMQPEELWETEDENGVVTRVVFGPKYVIVCVLTEDSSASITSVMSLQNLPNDYMQLTMVAESVASGELEIEAFRSCTGIKIKPALERLLARIESKHASNTLLRARFRGNFKSGVFPK